MLSIAILTPESICHAIKWTQNHTTRCCCDIRQDYGSRCVLAHDTKVSLQPVDTIATCYGTTSWHIIEEASQAGLSASAYHLPPSTYGAFLRSDILEQVRPIAQAHAMIFLLSRPADLLRRFEDTSKRLQKYFQFRIEPISIVLLMASTHLDGIARLALILKALDRPMTKCRWHGQHGLLENAHKPLHTSLFSFCRSLFYSVSLIFRFEKATEPSW